MRVYSTHILTMVNTMFANSKALKAISLTELGRYVNVSVCMFTMANNQKIGIRLDSCI